jgi:DNA protecting protein DprA
MGRNELIEQVMALLDLPGVGPAAVNRLADSAGSLCQLLRDIDTPDPSGRLSATMTRIREQWSTLDFAKYRTWIAESESIGSAIVIRDDLEYPANLRGVSSAPPILYVRGSLSHLSPRALALVGAVDPTERGLTRANRFARLCTAHSIQVISGLARGIDGAAHRAALDSGATTFAVLGHGLRHLFPPDHKSLAEDIAQSGALISQFAPGVRPSRWTFPARNELMCTLAKGTVIIEIEQEEKFGTVIQARFSIKHGRPVFVLRSNITELKSPEATKLVEDGDAVMVREFADVLSRLEVSGAEFSAPSLFSSAASARPAPLRPRAVLFDLDGVIYDPTKVFEAAYTEVIKALAGRSPEAGELASSFASAPPSVYRRFGVDYATANPLFNKAYGKLVAQLDCVFEPVVTFLRELRRRGFKVGVVTSQPRARFERVAARAGIIDQLDVSITWNETPRGKAKPHPDGLLKALAVLKVDPRDAFYVGDTTGDVEAARRAAVTSIAVTWGLGSSDDLLHFSPDYLVGSFDELHELLTGTLA